MIPDAPAKFVLRLCVLLGVLLLPWHRADELYAFVFRHAASPLVDEVFATFGRIRLDAVEPDSQSVDTEVIIAPARLPGHTAPAPFRLGVQSLRKSGYIPTALTIALALAMSVEFRTRLRILMVSLLACTAFIMLRELIVVAHFLCASDPPEPWRYSIWWEARVAEAFELTVANPTVSYLVPVLIWLAAAMTRGPTGLLESRGPQSVHNRNRTRGKSARNKVK